jgi:hypothetical protein
MFEKYNFFIHSLIEINCNKFHILKHQIEKNMNDSILFEHKNQIKLIENIGHKCEVERTNSVPKYPMIAYNILVTIKRNVVKSAIFTNQRIVNFEFITELNQFFIHDNGFFASVQRISKLEVYYYFHY